MNLASCLPGLSLGHPVCWRARSGKSDLPSRAERGRHDRHHRCRCLDGVDAAADAPPARCRWHAVAVLLPPVQRNGHEIARVPRRRRRSLGFAAGFLYPGDGVFSATSIRGCWENMRTKGKVKQVHGPHALVQHEKEGPKSFRGVGRMHASSISHDAPRHMIRMHEEYWRLAR